MRERATHTHIHRQLRSSHFQHYIMFCTETFRLFVVLCYNSGTCVRVLHGPDVFLCLCVPTHDTGIVILGDDELQYRPTLAALSKNKWWEFKTWDLGVANLGQLARIGGVLWDEIGHRGLRWRVNPRAPHAPCMARMSRVHG